MSVLIIFKRVPVKSNLRKFKSCILNPYYIFNFSVKKSIKNYVKIEIEEHNINN